MAFTDDLNPGINLIGQTQVTDSQLDQLVSAATPTDKITFVLWGAPGDFDLASNPRYTRYPLIDTSDSYTLKRYNGTIWVPFTLANGAIGTNQIADGAVTLAKLFNPGPGNALKLIRVNAASNGFELWTLSYSNGTIPIDALAVGGVGNNSKFLQVKADNSGFQLTTLNGVSFIADNSLPLNKLVYPAGGSGLFLVGSAGTGQVWRFFDPDFDLDDYSINITKLYPSPGTPGQYLGILSTGVFGFITPPSVPIIKDAGAQQALPAAAGVLTFPHSQASIPSIISGYWICMVAEQGYLVGDRIKLESFGLFDGSDSYFYPPSIKVDATNVYVSFSAEQFSGSRWDSTKLFEPLTRANWNLLIKTTV